MKEAKLDSEVVAKGIKSRAAAANNTLSALAGVRSWPSRTRSFLEEVRAETKRVTWPNLSQIRSTTIVVILTVFFFGIYFGILDWIFNNVVRRILRIGS